MFPAILRELRHLLTIQKERGKDTPEEVVVKIGVLGHRLEELGEKPVADKITVFFLAAMPMPPLPSDPPPETMAKFLLAMHEAISVELDRLEKIHLS